MSGGPGALSRLQFLTRVIRRECKHLATTNSRLFDPGLTLEQVARLEEETDLAERVEAFVGRFGRLQDTLGDKLLPQVLAALGERPGAAIDNLDRAERLGWISSTDEWFGMRYLRNQMVHEYIEDPAVLHSALHAAHRSVPTLVHAADRVCAEIQRRGWLE